MRAMANYKRGKPQTQSGGCSCKWWKNVFRHKRPLSQMRPGERRKAQVTVAQAVEESE
jgi:hypothetical protein